MLAAPRSAAAEAYRSLRVNVQFAGVDQEARMLAVTSADANAGKSTTTANLAVAMAEGGERVIIVDADLRRPSLHTLFGLANTEGLTTALLTDGAPLPLQETGVTGLRLLASGPLPPNPLEMLGSRRMAALLAELRQAADYVLFDTPPAAAVSDAAILAARLDGVILVVGAGRTRRDLAKRARERLDLVKARILGVVLSDSRESDAAVAY